MRLANDLVCVGPGFPRRDVAQIQRHRIRATSLRGGAIFFSGLRKQIDGTAGDLTSHVRFPSSPTRDAVNPALPWAWTPPCGASDWAALSRTSRCSLDQSLRLGSSSWQEEPTRTRNRQRDPSTLYALRRL